MWNARENGETKPGEGVVAIAVDREKSSQYALKWAIENLFPRDKALKLVHVVQRSASSPPKPGNCYSLIQQEPDIQASEVLLPYRCFCLRRQVQFETVILHEPDVAKALMNYVSISGVETMLMGASSKNGIYRIFKNSDVSSSVIKWAPDFCNVYIISKGKVNAMRPASRSLPIVPAVETTQPNLNNDADPDMLYDELSVAENDNSVLSLGRLSTDSNCLLFYENLGSRLPTESLDFSNLDNANPNTLNDFSDSERASFSQNLENMEDEIRRLKMELKQTMDTYHAACREVLVSKKQLIELQEWKMKKDQRMKDVELEALALVEKEKARCKEAIKEARRIAKQEVEMRVQKAEIKAMIEEERKQMVLDALGQSHTVLKYQSLFHILVVSVLFYMYFSLFK